MSCTSFKGHLVLKDSYGDAPRARSGGSSTSVAQIYVRLMSRPLLPAWARGAAMAHHRPKGTQTMQPQMITKLMLSLLFKVYATIATLRFWNRDPEIGSYSFRQMQYSARAMTEDRSAKYAHFKAPNSGGTLSTRILRVSLSGAFGGPSCLPQIFEVLGTLS